MSRPCFRCRSLYQLRQQSIRQNFLLTPSNWVIRSVLRVLTVAKLWVVLLPLAAFAARPETAIVAPSYIVNLDLAPSQRWTHIVNEHKQYARTLLDWIDTVVPPAVMELLEPVAAELEKYFPYPYNEEIRAVADATKDVGLNLGLLCALNIIYDLTAGCTSIVAQNELGQILHARNLDYPLPGLHNLTIQVDFQRNNRTVYTGTTFAGYVGLLSGMRPSGWSVTLNQRDRDAPGGPLDNIMHGLFKGGKLVGFLLRTALETDASFDRAMLTLQHTPLMAPCYLAVAGTRPGEGVIITRERDGPIDVWWIAAPHRWQVLQTNYDHWLPSGDNRAATAEAAMARLSPANVTLPLLYDVLSTQPVFQRGTIYTMLVNPAVNAYKAFIRHDAIRAAPLLGAKSPRAYLERMTRQLVGHFHPQGTR